MSLSTSSTSSSSLFEHPYRALVIGARGAIGKAFVAAFQQDPHCTAVIEVARSHGSGFNLEDEASIRQHAESVKVSAPFHIIIDATGALTIDGREPEKSLASLNAEQMLRNLHINAVGPALVLKHFAPLLATGAAGKVVYEKLSARVGSISDNQKGGWYSYRASKAALNMLLQTVAIELQRKNHQLRVVALQPGTVRSTLSQPFASSVPHLLEPAESVSGMMQALRNLMQSDTSVIGAQFVDYKGETIGW
jgi:NAD(P)-dependent dehydrogenase (short-subunit alcohol dehydrogenase family)